MNRSRNRNAWIWVAFAAIALASVARAEAGVQSARAYASPVFEFLAGSHAAQSAAMNNTARPAQYRNARHIKAASPDGLAGAWLAMLPVLFIGLVSPLNQLSSGSLLCLGGMPSAPLLPESFQRPPPLQFA
jgi:hypothetical protein